MNEELTENGYPKIDLTEMIQGVMRSIRHLMKAGLVLMAVLATVFCLRTWRTYSPVYEATASFTVRVTNPFYATQQHYNASAAEQMAQTFPYILGSNALSQRVMDQMDLPAMPAMSVSVLGNTNIVSLAVRGSDPQLCYDVLNCVMEVYPSVAEFVVGPTTMTLMSESGVPEQPVNTRNYPRSAALGLAMGLLVWMGASVLYWMTHRTVGSEEDLGRLANLECLGKIPNVKGFANKKNTYACPMISENGDKFGFSESIRLMRVRVEREMTRRRSKVLVVTSTIANEGKTTLSLNLAMSLAQKGSRVLLIDCDLRNPSIAQTMGKPRGPGLCDYLQRKVELDAVLHQEENPNLYTIFGGRAVSRPETLLHSSAMKILIAVGRKKFDYVILDTPPCAMMADTTEILSMADCALLLVRQNFACRRQITEGVQIMGDSRRPIIGCVMNMNAPRIGSGGYSYYSYYGYGYGYGSHGGYGGYGSYGSHSSHRESHSHSKS